MMVPLELFTVGGVSVVLDDLSGVDGAIDLVVLVEESVDGTDVLVGEFWVTLDVRGGVEALREVVGLGGRLVSHY